jgi:glycerate dehydrogenase
VLTNKTPLPAATLRELPGLRYVGVLATGVNIVDLAAAKGLGVTVTNVPGYSTASVAQHVFAMLLELTNRVAEHAAAVRSGHWTRCGDFAFYLGPLTELEGKVMGIVGLGAIGSRVATIAQALGMRTLAWARPGTTAAPAVPGVERLPLEALLAQSDVVTLHCPLTEATRHLMNHGRLALMKPSAVLINTGRGPLIDEPALAQALREGRLSGAALDVLSVEPPPADHPLLREPGCLITPHNAWASVEARRRLMQLAADNLQAFIAGRPIHVVNP